jgi:hypothetical protein
VDPLLYQGHSNHAASRKPITAVILIHIKHCMASTLLHDMLERAKHAASDIMQCPTPLIARLAMALFEFEKVRERARG